MSKLSIEYFIASRLQSGEQAKRDGIMTRIATVGVSLCVAIMLLSMFVVTGFQNTISEKITGLFSHIDIVNFENRYEYGAQPLNKNLPYLDDIKKLRGVKNIYPYATTNGIVKSKESSQTQVLRGIDTMYDATLLEGFIVSGRMLNLQSRDKQKEILLSESTANTLNIENGDHVSMIFYGEMPRRDRFKVVGLFNSSFPKFDNNIAITDIRNVQRLNDWNTEQVNGLAIELKNTDNLDLYIDKIETLLFENMKLSNQEMLIDIRDNYGDIFNWLKMVDTNAIIVIVIMIIVSALNMICMMLIVIMQKTSMIGVLKALGMRTRNIQRIFLIRMMKVVGYGLFFGNITAIIIALLQNNFGIIKLNAENYLMSEVPMEITISSIILVNLITFVSLILLQIIPTLFVAGLSPYKSLKYES